VSDIRINRAGQTAFTANLTGSGIDTSNARGGWVQGPNGLQLIYRGGDQAPGTPSGVLYAGSYSNGWIGFVLNGVGQTAYSTSLTGPGIDSTNAQAVWAGAPGSMALVARAGEHAPGTASGVSFARLSFDVRSLSLNDAGQVAFQAGLTGAGVNLNNDTGIWAGTPGNLSLVVREGDQVPGMASGVQFLDFVFKSAHLNNAGKMVFSADFYGPGASGEGIWSNASGSLALVARTGDLLRVRPPV
jgi:hypothetical protein